MRRPATRGTAARACRGARESGRAEHPVVSGRARREAGGWTHKTGSMTAVMAFTNMSTPTRFPARVGAVSRVARSAREAEREREGRAALTLRDGRAVERHEYLDAQQDRPQERDERRERCARNRSALTSMGERNRTRDDAPNTHTLTL